MVSCVSHLMNLGSSSGVSYMSTWLDEFISLLIGVSSSQHVLALYISKPPSKSLMLTEFHAQTRPKGDCRQVASVAGLQVQYPGICLVILISSVSPDYSTSFGTASTSSTLPRTEVDIHPVSLIHSQELGCLFENVAREGGGQQTLVN